MSFQLPKNIGIFEAARIADEEARSGANGNEAYAALVEFAFENENHGLNREQFNEVWSHAYTDGHAYGTEDIVNHYMSLGSLIKRVNKLA